MYILEYFVLAYLGIRNKIKITIQTNVSTFVHNVKTYKKSSTLIKKSFQLSHVKQKSS